MNHNRIILILSIALAALSNELIARSDDSSKPINIKANSAEINDATGISIYRGNVKITQGSMQLTGETVVLETANKKVQKITAEGNLSTFKQTTDDGKLIDAEAKKMVYRITANEIVLTDDAKLTESGNTFTSDRIVFYTDKEIVNAGSSSGNDRVSITVLPDTVKQEENSNASSENSSQ